MRNVLKLLVNNAVNVLIFTITLGVAGCDYQSAKFIVSVTRDSALEPFPGYVSIVSGHEAKSSDTNERDLLYLVVIYPGIQSSGESSETDWNKYVSNFNYFWDADTNSALLEISWDRVNDTIATQHNTYSREKGNLFVARHVRHNKFDIQQLGNIGPHAGFQEVLDEVRKQLPDDKLIASLKIQK